MRKRTFLTLAIVGWLWIPAAQACDLCAIYTALETKEAQPGWYVGLFQQYADFGTLREDGDEVANPADQEVESSISQLVVGYQLNHRWGVQVNAPYIDRSFRRSEGEAIERGSESGIGDVTVLAHWRAYEGYRANGTIVVNLLAGLKLPTGNSDRLGEEAEEGHDEDGHDGEEHEALTAGPDKHALPGKHEGHEHGVPSGVHGHDIALGSGSVDGIVGASVFASHGRAFGNAQLQYALRTEGDFDYRYANDLTWSLGGGYFVGLAHEHSLSLGVEVNGEKKGLDEFDGEPAGDTGLTAIYAGPTFAFSHAGGFYGELKADFPLKQDTTELQIVPDYRLRLGLTWRF